MRYYNITDIVDITQKGIIFRDNYFVDFNNCRSEWAKENNISGNETLCVAERYYCSNDKYFILYDTERIKISFTYKGLFKRRKANDAFEEFQVRLNRAGYTSYDRT